MKLPRHGAHLGKVFRVGQLYRDTGLPDDVLTEADGLPENLVENEWLGLLLRGARIGEQVSRERHDPVRASQDSLHPLDVGLLGPATLQFAEQVLPVHGDARQRVVDLMDDARGELAERGEFLRVDDLALELADFGPVSADRDDPRHSPFGIEDRRQRELQARRAASGLGQPKLERRDLPATERADERSQHSNSLARTRQPKDVFGDELRSVEPGNSAKRAADDPDTSIAADHQNRDVGVFQQFLEIIAKVDRFPTKSSVFDRCARLHRGHQDCVFEERRELRSPVELGGQNANHLASSRQRRVETIRGVWLFAPAGEQNGLVRASQRHATRVRPRLYKAGTQEPCFSNRHFVHRFGSNVVCRRLYDGGPFRRRRREPHREADFWIETLERVDVRTQDPLIG